jgi:hypothetical protein
MGGTLFGSAGSALIASINVERCDYAHAWSRTPGGSELCGGFLIIEFLQEEPLFFATRSLNS